jgi:hypothetical protein
MANSNVRIRYGKISPEGIAVSRRVFTTADGRQVKVELDTITKKFRILNATTGEQMAAGGHSVNLSILKIQAKRSLVSLGVFFGDESRDRGQE